MSFTARKVAELFISLVYKHHRFPASLVLDRDPIFISCFWFDLFKLSRTFLCMSSTYHPETNGQTEVMNMTIEQYLWDFIHVKPSLWVKFLPWTEYHYNTYIHSTSDFSPFQIMYGKPTLSIPAYVRVLLQIAACDPVLLEHDEILALL